MTRTDEAPQDSGQTNHAGAPLAAGPVVGPQNQELNKDARTWAMVCHLAGLAFLLPVSPAFGSVLGPLVVWLIKREQFPFVNEQGKEAVNFQITMLIYAVVLLPLCLICVGVLLEIALVVIDIVLIIVAAMKANDGLHYRYPKPFIIRLIK